MKMREVELPMSWDFFWKWGMGKGNGRRLPRGFNISAGGMNRLGDDCWGQLYGAHARMFGGSW